MAKFNGFNANQMVVVDSAYREARRVLERAVERAGTSTWREVFKRVMGSATGNALKEAEGALEETIKTMHLRIAGASFDVTYEPTFTNTNADMLSGKFSQSGGGALHTTFIDELRQQGVAPARLPMRLGPNFFTMPERDMFGQSRIETFLHELSHHAAGTIDDSNGGECYGLEGVNRLKGLGPKRAVRNAENVGFFLVWVA
jgi:hypothetical protein